MPPVKLTLQPELIQSLTEYSNRARLFDSHVATRITNVLKSVDRLGMWTSNIKGYSSVIVVAEGRPQN